MKWQTKSTCKQKDRKTNEAEADTIQQTSKLTKTGTRSYVKEQTDNQTKELGLHIQSN